MIRLPGKLVTAAFLSLSFASSPADTSLTTRSITVANTILDQQIQRELGDKFNLGRFHEAVLSSGSIPVKFLPEIVRTKLNLSAKTN